MTALSPRPLSRVRGAAGYALVLAAVAGMVVQVRAGRTLDRLADKCWGGER